MQRIRIALAALISAAACLVIWPGAAESAEFACTNQKCTTIAVSGEIVAGDSERLVAEIRRSPSTVLGLTLHSHGGDPFEAIAIADVANRYFIPVYADQYSQCEAMRRPCRICASACALIFMTAHHRVGTEVYIHRPTFPASVLATMPASDFEAAYNHAVGKLSSMLRDRQLSESDLNDIMSVPSDRLVKLRSGYPEASTWLAEWLKTKCPLKKSDGSVSDVLFGQPMCKTKALRAEAERIQADLKRD